MFDHYILSREWRVIVDQVHTNYHGRSTDQSGVTELLIMRDHHYGRMLYILRSSTFLAVEKTSAFGLGLFHS